MKLKITQRGVHGSDEKEIPVGTVIEVEGGVIPPALINKAERIAESPEGAELRAGAEPDKKAPEGKPDKKAKG